MIELAKNGNLLLKGETKYRGGKYIPTVMKNILDGKIKYEYEEGVDMTIDEEAPFKHNLNQEYNEEEYIFDEENADKYFELEHSVSDIDDSNDIDYENNIKNKVDSKNKDE